MVVGVVVYVLGRVGGRHHGKCHKRECLGLRFLQVVAAVIPTALQVACIELKTCLFFTVSNHLACAVFHVARTVEPGFRIAATLDSEELERGVLCHGVNVVADNKGARNIVTYLDAQAFLGRYRFGNVADLDDSGLSGNVNLIT